ncbi:MAG: dTMP kinase [Xanthomonadales bacterium]|nr:dTMP kinase [Xanthomonadales bacterium]
MKGRFITLEGGEGAGKSSSIRTIRKLLDSSNISYVVSREPGGTELAERIRNIILDPRIEDMSAMTELLLVFAARCDHVEKTIVPALKSGTWVVCDRFVDASFAYQGGGRGLPLERIETLKDWLPGALEPDLTILLDVPPELGLKRATRDRAADRLEKEKGRFYRRVRDAYLEQASSHARFHVIDARQKPEAVQAELRQRIQQFIEEDGK